MLRVHIGSEQQPVRIRRLSLRRREVPEGRHLHRTLGLHRLPLPNADPRVAEPAEHQQGMPGVALRCHLWRHLQRLEEDWVGLAGAAHLYDLQRGPLQRSAVSWGIGAVRDDGNCVVGAVNWRFDSMHPQRLLIVDLLTVLIKLNRVSCLNESRRLWFLKEFI
jgi:hypothetical protein